MTRGNWATFVHRGERLSPSEQRKPSATLDCRTENPYGSEYSKGWVNLLGNYPVLSTAGAGADRKVHSILARLDPCLYRKRALRGPEARAEQKGPLCGCL